MIDLLYQSGNWFCILRSYFLSFMETALSDVSIKTLYKYVYLILAMLVDETAYSVRTLYTHTLCRIGQGCIYAYYKALSNAGKGDHLLLSALAKKGVSLADPTHPKAPFLLGVDDTTIKKFGKCFYGVGTLFDHSSHEKEKYINGHCFVSASLHVPVASKGNTWHYVPVPLGFELWKPGEDRTKFDIACDLIAEVMDIVGSARDVIILCDSWYTKKNLLQLTRLYPNLHLVGNARSDTSCRLYDAPEKDPHKRGRAPSHGCKLALSDFVLTKDSLNGYHLGYEKVAISMLKEVPVWAFVSSPTLTSENKSKRLFLSTIDPANLANLLEGFDKIPEAFNQGNWKSYSPMLAYAERWQIEVFFENMKTFWSLTEYKVRTEKAIPRYLNLICLAYVGASLLPYEFDAFAMYKDRSPQELRQIISTMLKDELHTVERINQMQAMSAIDIQKNTLMMAEYKVLYEKINHDTTTLPDQHQYTPQYNFDDCLGAGSSERRLSDPSIVM